MRVNTNLIKFNWIESLTVSIRAQLACDEVATLEKMVFSLVGVHKSVGGN